jgi:hypothetical protein
MIAVAHDKEFAKKVGIPQNVAREFESADEAKAGKKKSRADKLYGNKGKD